MHERFHHDLTSNPENNKIGYVTKDCKQQREWKGLQREKGMDSDRQMRLNKVRMGEVVRQDFRQAFPTERSFARPATQHLSSDPCMWKRQKSEMTSFLTLCRTGNGSFLSGLTLFLSQRTARQKAPGRDLGRLKNPKCKNKVVHYSPSKSFTFELLTQRFILQE